MTGQQQAAATPENQQQQAAATPATQQPAAVTPENHHEINRRELEDRMRRYKGQRDDDRSRWNDRLRRFGYDSEDDLDADLEALQKTKSQSELQATRLKTTEKENAELRDRLQERSRAALSAEVIAKAGVRAEKVQAASIYIDHFIDFDKKHDAVFKDGKSVEDMVTQLQELEPNWITTSAKPGTGSRVAGAADSGANLDDLTPTELMQMGHDRQSPKGR